MSWHLQTLARYGFVEEAGGGRGRQRPWRLVSIASSFPSRGEDDQDLQIAADALDEVVHERHLERLRSWLVQRHRFSARWRKAAFRTATIAYLTDEELSEVGEEILAVIGRYQERTLDPSKRPRRAKAVNLVAFGHPLPPTRAGN